MPWNQDDAQRFTKKASSPARRKAWTATANAVLAAGQSEGVAVRAANKHVKEMIRRRGR